MVGQADTARGATVTATVFAEILVLGFQTFAFIALAVVALVGCPAVIRPPLMW
jgi:hypothetical protein